VQLCNILYLPVYKLFKTLLHFVDTEYYRDKESCLKGLEMALNEVYDICYMAEYQDDEDICLTNGSPI
jgi:hypothetical protein